METIKKHYAVHLKNILDAKTINVRRAKMTKKEVQLSLD